MMLSLFRTVVMATVLSSRLLMRVINVRNVLDVLNVLNVLNALNSQCVGCADCSGFQGWAVVVTRCVGGKILQNSKF